MTKEPLSTRVEVLGHPDKPVAAPCCIDGCQYTSATLELRRLLWLRHGCPFSALYGDDGEMQCHACQIDFKRDPVAHIERRWLEQARRT